MESPALDLAASNSCDVVDVDDDVCIPKDTKAVDDVVDLEVSECWGETVNNCLSSGHSKPRFSTLWQDL